MPPASPFHYVVVRVVPRVERGECFNAGVVLFCRPLEFLGARVHLDERRLAALAPGVAADALRPYLDAVEAIAAGSAHGGPIARLDRGERFHWLASPASTVIQPSPIHTGLCTDPGATLDRLFRELVRPPRREPGGDNMILSPP